MKYSSDYTMEDNGNGFVIEADRLNKTLVKEIELNTNDIVEVTHQADAGSWYIQIGKDGKEPVFYGNTSDEFGTFSVEIPESGTYEIICKGRNEKGNIEF